MGSLSSSSDLYNSNLARDLLNIRVMTTAFMTLERLLTEIKDAPTVPVFASGLNKFMLFK